MLTLYAPEYASVRVVECSPPSWMAHIALEEKGLPHRIVWLSFARGEHRGEAMLAKNPRGTIPVLEDGDICVHETLGILHYLEDAYPQPALLPRSTAERARAITRLHESTGLKDAGMALFVALMRDGDGIAGLWSSLHAELAHWERYLASAPFVAGPELSLADLVVYTYLETALRLGLELAAEPALADFSRRMRERKSVAKTWPWPAR